MPKIDIEKAIKAAVANLEEEETPAKRAAREIYNSQRQDYEDEDSGFRVPFVAGGGDKGYTFGVGRLEKSADLDKYGELTGYVDALAQKVKGDSAKVKPVGAGVRYRKSFKKGGKVSSASKRADGIAQRGKTKGKIY